MLTEDKTIQERDWLAPDQGEVLFERNEERQVSGTAGGKAWSGIEGVTPLLGTYTKPASAPPRFRLTLVIAH